MTIRATDRVAECIHPERKSCRGCSESLDPALYDGGCMLHYGERGGKNLHTRRPGQRSEDTTQKSANSNGGYTPAREERRE